MVLRSHIHDQLAIPLQTIFSQPLSLLWRHRTDDINMSSVWECSRNDIASNISVFVAAAGVWLLQSGWPDVLVGLGLACLFLRSAYRVLSAAFAELREAA